MNFMVCPFCGVASEVAHDSQQACIKALQAEIERTRAVLTNVGEPLRRPRRESGDDSQQA
jgi:hypothetical protein